MATRLAILTSPAGETATIVKAVTRAAEFWGLRNAEAAALFDTLMAHATDRRYLYTHRWRTNDLVMWDNRCTMHRGTDFDDLRWPRDGQRATVLDVAPTCEQEGLVPEAQAAAAE